MFDKNELDTLARRYNMTHEKIVENIMKDRKFVNAPNNEGKLSSEYNDLYEIYIKEIKLGDVALPGLDYTNFMISEKMANLDKLLDTCKYSTSMGDFLYSPNINATVHVNELGRRKFDMLKEVNLRSEEHTSELQSR